MRFISRKRKKKKQDLRSAIAPLDLRHSNKMKIKPGAIQARLSTQAM